MRYLPFDAMGNERNEPRVRHSLNKKNNQPRLGVETGRVFQLVSEPVGEGDDVEQLLSQKAQQNETERVVDCLDAIGDGRQVAFPLQQLLIQLVLPTHFVDWQLVGEVLEHHRRHRRQNHEGNDGGGLVDHSDSVANFQHRRSRRWLLRDYKSVDGVGNLLQIPQPPQRIRSIKFQ